MQRLPIAVLVSGNGSNLQAILDASSKDGFAAAICVVISDRPGVLALQRAEEAGVPSVVVPWADYGDRNSFSTAVCDVADRHGATALVLAGFLRILAPTAMRRFPPASSTSTRRCSRPSRGPFMRSREALDHGVKVTGVTVHFVDEQVDARADHRPGGGRSARRATMRRASTAGCRMSSTGCTPTVVDALAGGGWSSKAASSTWKEPS